MDSSKFTRILLIFLGFFPILSYPVGIWLDSLVFLWILSVLDSIRIYLVFFRNICFFYFHLVFGFSRTLSHSSGLCPIFLEFSRILSDSFRFFGSLSFSLGICPDFVVFSRTISDSSRFSRNLDGFSHIPSYSFGILYVFFPKLSDFEFF
mgnify:FL=1